MKKGNGIIFGIVLVLALSLCHFEQVEAKQKQNGKPLKQEWAKKTEEFSYETVTIEKGKTYTLKELIKPVSQRKSIFYDLNEKLYKGYKITISGKGLLLKNKTISGKKPLVKKKTIRADKVGEYWLKVKLKDSFHLFRVEAVDKYFNVKENEVAKIIITDYEEHLNEGYRISEPIRVEITDPFQIRQIVSKLKMPKYAFSFARIGGSVPCIDEYNVGFYASDGRRLAWYIMMPFGMLNSKCDRKAENLPAAQECYDYIYKLYKDMLSQIPKRSWE